MMHVSVEAALTELLTRQSTLRSTTAGLESKRPRAELDAIVSAQLEHLDELIEQVASALRVAVPAVRPSPRTSLDESLLSAHARVASGLRLARDVCERFEEKGLGLVLRRLLDEHTTLSSGLARLIGLEALRSRGGLARA
jgi:hypothetical protein